jgi:A/G-specific adenine glycosylase
MSGARNDLYDELLGWYRRHARDLPWRTRHPDPYAVWVSETMLQQTQVQTVIPYYERFLQALPDVHALAEAPEERVLALWSGLGYYRRARMLHAAAKTVCREHGGRVPSDPGELLRLQGVGAYTSGAVASIAFGRPVPLVDGNVARVLARLFAVHDDVKGAKGRARIWALAGELASGVGSLGEHPGDWNQALMELGATVCLPGTRARCDACPVAARCDARARGPAAVAELPRSAPKAPPKLARRVAVVIASPTHVVLARRRSPPFAGLWEPPSGGLRALEEVAAGLGVDSAALTPVAVVEHVLSHRTLRIRVVRAALGRRRRWAVPSSEYDAVEAVRIADLPSRGHATVTRKILAAAGVPLPRDSARAKRRPAL